jgi:hypothetical protein
MRTVSALMFALLLCGCASTPSDTSAIFVLTDPRGDDYGDGSIDYPMSGEMKKGDLDLIELAAFPTDGGTMFSATFAQPIDVPQRQTVDTVGTSLDEMARLGFYTFNIDIYIDTDRQPDSGSVSTIPGRKLLIDPATAWEKVIIVTPDPGLARSELRRLLYDVEKKEMRATGEKADEPTMKAKRETLRANIDAYTYFPDRITVQGSRIDFFVPSSVFAGSAKPDWAYTVVVSGADLVERLDTRGRLVGTETYDTLYILPVNVGRPLITWATTREDFVLQPPVIDVILPAGQDQKQVLGDFSGTKQVVLTGVVPGQ